MGTILTPGKCKRFNGEEHCRESNVGWQRRMELWTFRNTVREGYCASPAQLFGRKCLVSRLIPKLATYVYRDKTIAKNTKIAQYNKSAYHLNPLAPGDAIRMKLPG